MSDANADQETSKKNRSIHNAENQPEGNQEDQKVITERKEVNEGEGGNQEPEDEEKKKKKKILIIILISVIAIIVIVGIILLCVFLTKKDDDKKDIFKDDKNYFLAVYNMVEGNPYNLFNDYDHNLEDTDYIIYLVNSKGTEKELVSSTYSITATETALHTYQVIFSVSLTSTQSMFEGLDSLISVDLSHLNTNNVELIDHMFQDCTSLVSINLKNFQTNKVIDVDEKSDGFSGLFVSCSALKEVDISSFDSSNVKVMSSMFNGCESLERIVGIEKLDTSKVINMAGMFSDCTKITSIDTSNFKTSNVKDMTSLFSGCENLKTVNLKSFLTPNVESMEDMFLECKALTRIEANTFQTSSCHDFDNMFKGCEQLTSLDISSFTFNTGFSDYSAEHMFDGLCLVQTFLYPSGTTLAIPSCR